MITTTKFYIGILTLLLVVSSCKKFVEVDPPIDKLIGQEIFRTNAGAASVLAGMYWDLSAGSTIAKERSSIGVRTGLYSDELTLYPAVTDILLSLYTNNLIVDPDIWGNLYGYIFRVNSAIEGINASNTLSSSVKSQLLGEAKFLRGFFYFYLINLYGDVPLVMTTDLSVNTSLPRSDKAKVFEQIIADLQEAEEELNKNYLSGDAITIASERARPNKAAAVALLARVFLYTGDWQNAEVYASRLINDSTKYRLQNELENVFKSNSDEIIWALQPTTTLTAWGTGKTDAGFYILTSGLNTSQPVYLSDVLLNSFEATDHRKTTWINSFNGGPELIYYPYKYRDISESLSFSEYTVVLRLAEQYLIRAEARARQGNISGINSAASDLNAIRNRAGLTSTSQTDLEGMLNAILTERKHELFTEWGHRWLDLKRTGNVDAVMSVIAPLKGGTWSSYKALFPLPVQDIQRNPNLRGHQNPGYPEN